MLRGSEFTNLNLPKVLCVRSSVLGKLVARNDRLVDDLSPKLEGSSCDSVRLGKRFNAFHGLRAPSISMPKYLERIYKYIKCSPSCFVLGFVYIDKMTHRHPGSLLLSLNVHRLPVTSVIVAFKMLDDEHYNNVVYARVGGVGNAELNRLELELLFLLDFGVAISSRYLKCYCWHLEKEMLINETRAMTIERALTPNTLDDQISVEDNKTSSPPQIAEGGLT